MDDTHFVYELDNTKCLNLHGTAHVNYLNVVSGAEEITVVLRVTGVSKAKLASLFLIFKNNSENYTIKSTPNLLSG